MSLDGVWLVKISFKRCYKRVFIKTKMHTHGLTTDGLLEAWLVGLMVKGAHTNTLAQAYTYTQTHTYTLISLHRPVVLATLSPAPHASMWRSQPTKMLARAIWC